MSSEPHRRTRAPRVAGLMLAVLLALALSACGGDDGPEAEWTLPNGGVENHRQAGSDIDSGNVEDLAQVWGRTLTEGASYGFFASTPLVSDGVAYLQDLASNVTAVDVESGETLWTREYGEQVIGPNGLALDGDGTLYGVTMDSVFALDSSDGAELWRRDGLKEGEYSLTIAPQVHDGRVYLGTITHPEGGTIFALDAGSGETVWSFDTLAEPASLPEGRSAGGVWYPPLVSGGHVYFGIGNPYITPRDGLEDPQRYLYTNSIVKLDAETGELAWHHQTVPNDFYDWDMQLSPIRAEADGEELILGGGKMGYVYAIDPDDGALVWERAVGEHGDRDDDPERALEDPGSVTLDPPEEILPGPYGGVETPMAYEDGTVYASVVNLSSTLTDLDVNFGGESGTFDFEGGTGEMVAIDVATGEIEWATDLPSMVFGSATISNDLVFTTTFEGEVLALSRDDGSIVWRDDLPAGTNAPVTVAGDTLITASSYPQGRGQEAQVVAYRLGAEGPPTTVGPPETETEGGEAPEPVSGRAVFRESCGSCHVLADAETEGAVGPNLDRTTPDEARVEEMVRFGGGGMPAFEATLSDEEISAVAAYVASAAGDGGDEEGSGPAP